MKDIDSNGMQIRVEQAKGKKDRYTILGNKALEVLRIYVVQFKPKIWLFEGKIGEQYAARTIQEILRKSVEKTNIKKKGNSTYAVALPRDSYPGSKLQYEKRF